MWHTESNLCFRSRVTFHAIKQPVAGAELCWLIGFLHSRRSLPPSSCIQRHVLLKPMMSQWMTPLQLLSGSLGQESSHCLQNIQCGASARLRPAPTSRTWRRAPVRPPDALQRASLVVFVQLMTSHYIWYTVAAGSPCRVPNSSCPPSLLSPILEKG